MKGGRGIVCIFVIVALLLLVTTVPRNVNASGCPPTNPSCAYCGDGVISCPNYFGVCEVCDINRNPTGCPAGYTCNADCGGCTQSTPPPCGPLCPPAGQVACNTYADNGCGGTCTTLGTQCTSGTCYPAPYNCCTPGTVCSVTPGSTLCGQIATGTLGCGVPCTVTGTQCLMDNGGGLPSCG